MTRVESDAYEAVPQARNSIGTSAPSKLDLTGSEARREDYVDRCQNVFGLRVQLKVKRGD